MELQSYCPQRPGSYSRRPKAPLSRLCSFRFHRLQQAQRCALLFSVDIYLAGRSFFKSSVKSSKGPSEGLPVEVSRSVISLFFVGGSCGAGAWSPKSIRLSSALAFGWTSFAVGFAPLCGGIALLLSNS